MKHFLDVTSIDQIDEGRLKKAIDDELVKAQDDLFETIQKYGTDATKKSKAEVTVKITLQFDGGSQGDDFSIKGAVSRKVPGQPVSLTKAVWEKDQTNVDRLYSADDGPVRWFEFLARCRACAKVLLLERDDSKPKGHRGLTFSEDEDGCLLCHACALRQIECAEKGAAT